MVADALRRLVVLDGQYQELITDAREYLGSGEPPQVETDVVVGLADVERALNQYEKGALSGEQLQEWADVLEMNEHVRYECGAEEAVADLLFRLSSPEINEPITPPAVRRLRASLNESKSGR